MTRFVVWTLTILLLAVAILAGAVALVVSTEAGTRLAWRTVQPMLPDGLHVDSLSGRLAGPLTLRGIALDLPSVQLGLDRVYLDWQPLALLDGTVHIVSLSLTDGDMTILPMAEPDVSESAPQPILPNQIELPLAVILDEVTLDDFSYRAGPEAEPLIIDRVRVVGQFDDREFSLGELDGNGPQFDLRGRATLRPRYPYAGDAELEWSLRLPTAPAAQGTTAVRGDLRALVIEQRIEAPYNVEAEFSILELLDVPKMDGVLDFGFDTTDLDVGLPAATVTGSVSIEGPPDQIMVDARVDISTAEFDTLVLDLEAGFTGSSLAIDGLTINHPLTNARVRAEGDLALTTPPQAELDVAWSGLRWPLRDETQFSSEAGSLSIEGNLDDYRIVLDTELAIGLTEGEITARGTGSTESLQLFELEAALLEGTLAGEANLHFTPALLADIQLAADGINPGVLLDGWPGQVGGRLRASGGIGDAGPHVSIGELSLDGTLRERPFDLSARGQYEAALAEVENLHIESGSTLLDLRAIVGESIDAEFNFNSEDLEDFWPGVSGQMSLTGNASGPLTQPRVVVDASGQGIDLLMARVSDLTLQADVDLTGAGDSLLELTVRDGSAAGTDIDSLRVNAEGNAADHRVGIDAITSLGQASIAFAGKVNQIERSDVSWEFILETASIDPETLGAWQLRMPSSGRLTAGRASIELTCWQHASSELCIEAARQPEGVSAGWTLEQLPFDYFAAFTSELGSIEGSFSTHGRYQAPPEGEAELIMAVSSTDGRLVSAQEGGPSLDFGPIEAEVDAGAAGVVAELSIPVASEGSIELNARIGPEIDAEPFAARSIDARALVRLDELDVINELSDQIGEVTGSLNADIVVSGAVGTPRLGGTVALSNGSARLFGPNVILEDVEFAATGDDTDRISIQGQVASGEGQIAASGVIELGASGPRGTLTIAGNDFEAVNTLDVQASVSPDLEFSLSPDRIDVNGSVMIPTAQINPRYASDESVVTVSSDQIIVQPDRETVVGSDTLPAIYADVTIEFGDDVGIEAFGLTGELAGAVVINQVPGEPTRGRGEFRIEDGTYAAYGQELEIRTGRLLFVDGPVERPGLDIEAVRRPAPDVLVGARVRGTLAQPELSLFSEPPMQQQEQLSYLVLGRPLGGNTSSEESALARAALSLGLRGGNFVSERINESLGLDEFGIQTEPGESASAASFVIGKYLSPSLYVSYGVGLFNPVATLQLRYTISEHWRLATESSDEQSGGDIIWNVERSTY